ncbi:MAG: hypothetical protein HC907_29155, partial [Richelia sp. SM1_7_0]|nr:hypothetical protein [Richelia sp. SM1_7_0]
MEDILIRIIILIVSLFLAYFVLKYVKSDPFILNAMFITYMVWHFPLVLSIVLPFTYPQRELDNVIYIAIILLIIHLIQIGGVLGYKTRVNKSSLALIGISLKKGNSILANHQINPLDIYKISAYLSPILIAIDTYIFKGVSFSLNLNEQREVGIAITPFLTITSYVFSAVALYLINWCFYYDNHDRFRFNLSNYLPFLLSCLIFLSYSNRQYFIIGIVITVLNLIQVKRLTLQKTFNWMVKLFLFILPTMLSIQLLRAITVLDKLDRLIITNMQMEIIDFHPLANFTQSSQFFRTIAAIIYLYYGTTYDALCGIIKSVEPFAPITSFTLTPIYNEFSDLFDLPMYESLRVILHGQVESEYGIFPRIWSTMFGSFYAENGWYSLIFYSIILFLLHLFVVKNYIHKTNKNNINKIILYHSFMIIGIMFISTHSSQGVFYLMLVFFAPPVNMIIKTYKKRINLSM